MATLNASKWGYIIGQASENFVTASTTGLSATNNPTNDSNLGRIRYVAYSGRGSLTHSLRRTYVYFDTSSITDTVTACTLNIEGYFDNSSDIIVLKSTAFGGDGSSSLTTGEFYTSLDYNTTYSNEITSWSTSGNNSITLKSNALTAITNDDSFILALINSDYDYTKTASAVEVENQNGIAFSTTIYLDYETAPSPTPTPTPSNTPTTTPTPTPTLTPTPSESAIVYNIDSVNNVEILNVNNINGVSFSNIFKIQGVPLLPEPPGYEYYRFYGVDSSGNQTSARQMIVEAMLYEGINLSGTKHPTQNLTSDTSFSGVTVTKGYQYSASYASWEAFDGDVSGVGSSWWTLGLGTASLNWLGLQFNDGRKEIKSIRFYVAENFTEIDGIKIYGSNTGSFSGEETLLGYLTGPFTGSSITTHDINLT